MPRLSRSYRRLLTLALALPVTLFLLAFLYQVGMRHLEGQPRTLLASLEWAGETLTTTGYGRDTGWTHPLMQAYVITVQFIGLFMMFLVFPIFMIPFFEERFEARLATALPNLKGQVLIYRNGPAVTSLLRELDRASRAYPSTSPRWTMKTRRSSRLLRSGLAAILAACATTGANDPLPSWNQGSSRQAVIQFVTEVTTIGGPGFVPADQRVAVFDNDGTLWAEQPAYAQIAFAIDRVKALAPQHPEWKERQPFKGVLENDFRPLIAGGEHALLELVMATHAGGTTEEFEQTVRQWIATARHPTTGRPYTSMVYQPMLEVLAYLRANGFKTFIVSGGGVEFMRPWIQEVYGIPPEQVVGSSIRTKFEIRDGQPVLVRLPEIDFVNDGPGKPVGIHQYVGRRPIAAFGNSDGDLAMLQWTCAGGGPHLCLYVHHTDSAREWAYDRHSSIGRLDRGLDEAAANGWTVVNMKQDWRQIFAVEKQ